MRNEIVANKQFMARIKEVQDENDNYSKVNKELAVKVSELTRVIEKKMEEGKTC